MKHLFLSYPLGLNTPVYGNYKPVKMQPQCSMEQGHVSNKVDLELDNHTGTHIDFPRHFLKEGATGDELPARFFLFSNVQVAEVTKQRGLIGPEDLQHLEEDEELELLLLKTGLCYQRQEEAYWKTNPGIAPEVAAFLRKLYPNLRLLGFDLISLNSFEHEEAGIQAHKEFLGGGMLILEDVDLREVKAGTAFEQVVVAPLLLESCDGAPCSVIASMHDEEEDEFDPSSFFLNPAYFH